jgi:hypothetical protein
MQAHLGKYLISPQGFGFRDSQGDSAKSRESDMTWYIIVNKIIE